MTECLCATAQDQYADGSYARSYTLEVSTSCPNHGHLAGAACSNASSLALFRMSILKDSYASLTERDRKLLTKKLPQHFTSALGQLLKSAIQVELEGRS